MSFSFNETPESRAQSSGTSSTASHTLTYIANGEQDDYTVHAYAIANTPTYVVRPTGTLYRNGISVRPNGFQQYIVEVSYGKLDKNSLPSNSYTFNFDTTGGTTNVKCGKSHIASYNSGGTVSSPDHKGAIGVRSDGTVDGVDIIIPKLRINLSFKFASGSVTAAYMKSLAAITGCTNSKRYLGFDAGELLFLGATGSNGSNMEMEVTYSFEASGNVTGLSSGGITGIAKKGHEYLWHEFDDQVDTGKPVTRAKYVHIEQVYDSADFEATFAWNQFTGV